MAKRLLLLGSYLLAALVSLVLTAGTASATLIEKPTGAVFCGGDSFTGTEAKRSVTDAAGNVFTLNCVNRDYFQGSVFVKSTGKTTMFGRCLYAYGANIINYEVNADDDFTDIEWVNVKPPESTAAARNKIIDDLSNGTDVNKPTLSTKDWLAKANKYFKDNSLENTDKNNDKNIIYTFPFSPNNQEIFGFQNDTLELEFVLTPDEANATYLPDGLSTIPQLEIDPLMRVPGASVQSEGVPEPPASLLLASALAILGLASGRRRKSIACCTGE